MSSVRAEAGQTAVGSRARDLAVGAVARVESSSGAIWSAEVRYTSGNTVGLRGLTVLDSRFAAREVVTLTIGHDETLVASQARILTASGSSMRLQRRESFDGLERNRRAVRVPVSLPTTIESPDGSLDRDALMLDLSAVGCAVLTMQPALIGQPVTISTQLDDAALVVGGVVVRTWIGPDSLPAMGINFDLIPGAVERLITQYLVRSLRLAVAPTR